MNGDKEIFVCCDCGKKLIPDIGHKCDDKLKMSALLGLEFKEYKGDSDRMDDKHQGYNQAIEDLDQREIDVNAIAKIYVKYFKASRDGDAFIKELADNMKMWVKVKQ